MTTIALIAGAGGDGYYWHLVVPRLQAAECTVVAPDLPAGDETAGFDEYAEAVVAAVRASAGRPRAANVVETAAGQRVATDEHTATNEQPDDLGEQPDDLIVVAQSLGGFTGVRVCELSAARMLVFVNAMIPQSGETAGEWWQATGQAEAQRTAAIAEGRDPDAGFDVNELFFHDVPADVTADLVERGEPSQSEKIFESAWRASGWPAVEVRVIAGRHDRLFPLDFMQKLSRERVGVEPVVIDSGHLAALAAPDALADLILKFVNELH